MKKLLLLGFFFLFPLNMMAGTTSTYAKPQVQSVSQSEVKQVLARLLKNQEDIGNAIKQVYGEKAGNKLKDLLKEHIVIAGKIVDAAKSGNEVLVKQLNKEWYRNADEIAACFP